jgi:voltage-gated potassium channel
MNDETRPRYLHLQQSWGRPLDVLVILAALATIPIVILQERHFYHVAVSVIDWLIWAIFLVEFVFGIIVAENRKAYARGNWLGVAVIVFSFPLLPDLLASIRVLRVARIARLLRVLAVTGRGLSAMRSTLAGQSLIYVAALTTLLTISAAALMSVIEPETVRGDFGSSLWWAVVTVTTVGYGDIAPVTPIGRVLAVVLMLSGLGLLSTLAASISAYFVGSDNDLEIAAIHEHLGRIERLLEQMNDGGSPARSNPKSDDAKLDATGFEGSGRPDEQG